MIPKFSGLLAGIAVVALSSCSSVYKSGQTPDDVYYSPGKPVAAVAKGDNDTEDRGEYVETNKRRSYNRNNEYDSYNYRDDQYMRMMISSGRRPYGYGYYDDFAMMDPMMYNNWRWNSYMTWNSPWNSPYNSMWYWNSFYNPYCRPVYVIPSGGYIGKPGYGYGNVVARPSRPASAFGMSSYLNTSSNSNRTYKPYSYYRGGSYNNSNSREYNSGTSRRSLFGGNSNNNNNSSYDRPSRSYSPSSNTGSSSGSRPSSGSSGGGVSRPARTGN
jgi:hypothetical protein